MTENIILDFEKIGFKAGLEIHQQLDAGGRKLFCNCPSILRKDNPDYVVSRKLHAVAGESGEVDAAAMHEMSKDREFIYEVHENNSCLVELDESPPGRINEEALRIALQISLLLNAKIFPITQIMRKNVIDGSNTSGFQRTVMIARGGYVDTSSGRVGVEGIYLEEDSARVVKKESEKVFYKLDRLGIPLVEISTDAVMKNSEQVKEVALHIGNVLRSCNIRRGIGTIRQDINLSIKKGSRVELKGFQDPKIMTQSIENEIKRQLEIINSGKKLEPQVRNVLADATSEYLRPLPGASRMYPETDLPLLKISRDFINQTKKTLPKLKTEIREELKIKGLNQEMIKLIIKENIFDELKYFLKILDNPSLIAKILLVFPREIAKKEKRNIESINEFLNKDILERVVSCLKENKISENQVKDVLIRIVKGEDFDKIIKSEKKDISEIEEKIMKMIKQKPGLSLNAYMGLAMKDSELRNAVSGKEAMEIIQKITKDFK